MKYLKILLFILVIFSKTGNVLSKENLFNVNNVELTKNPNTSNEEMANKAIKLGFDKLMSKILLKDDYERILKSNISEIKQFVSYYQIKKNTDKETDSNKIVFNIFFDKEKLHSLFYKKNIFYSDIADKELYLLPILVKNNQFYIFNQNFFYQNWNSSNEKDLIEFILPIENIEVIQNINLNKENLLDLDLRILFKEYTNKNLALVIIEELDNKIKKIYLKTRILEKNIDKNILINKENLVSEKFYNKIINQISKEITNIIKSQNLIDIRTPSFLNAKLKISKKNSIVELNKRVEQVDLIDGIFVQEFNSEFVLIKIKFIGKLNKIIKQLEKEKIKLELKNEQWRLRIL